MDRLQYLDFEPKIEREGDHYAARVLRSPVGEAAGTFTLPFSEDRLALLVLKLGRLRSGTRAIRSEEIEAARELGGKLFEAVFGGEVRACLRSSLDEAQRQEGTGLRLKLRLQEAAELADLPWEYLYDPSLDRFIAQSNQTPIVTARSRDEVGKHLRIYCTSESLRRWEFSRGNLLSTIVTFKIEKFPLKAAVEIIGEPPGTVHTTVEVLGRGKFSIFGASDRKYLSDQLDLLEAYLTGAR